MVCIVGFDVVVVVVVVLMLCLAISLSVGQKLKSGELTNLTCIPTSERTRELAEHWRIPLITLNDKSVLDVAIDGADDVDVYLNLVKGGGGALLREKMVEINAKKFICIVDESKLSTRLGKSLLYSTKQKRIAILLCCVEFCFLFSTAQIHTILPLFFSFGTLAGPSFPLPVEVTPFCYLHTKRQLEALPSLAGCEARLRMGSAANNKVDGENIAVTDNGNYIFDIYFPVTRRGESGGEEEGEGRDLTVGIVDVQQASKELYQIVGVVEHGIFPSMAHTVIVAGEKGIRIAGEGGEAPWWGL